MGFNALWVALFLLVAAVLWLLLRKPKSKAVSKSNPGSKGAVKNTSVSRPSAKTEGSAELPVFEAAPSVQSATPRRPLPPELEGFHLVLYEELDASARERVDSICSSMPEPHPVQRQLANGLDTPDELMEAVSSDAGLTASILRTVNSAAFSLAAPITSVQHAITYLGVSVVKGLVAQAAVAEHGDEGTPEQQAALARIWKSACSASALAQILGQELGIERPSVLATKALFFNLGDIALATGVPGAPAWYTDGASIVSRVTAQQDACAANTAILGATLARMWHLPDDIADAIESGFVPLVTHPSDYTVKGDSRKDSVLLYLVGRIGDRVAYRGLRDIGDLQLVGSEEPALFYLAEHLETAGLGRVAALFQDPAFKRKVNRVLQTLAG